MSTQAPSAVHLLDDPWLQPWAGAVSHRAERAAARAAALAGKGTLAQFARAHEWYGLHRDARGWVFREFAPNATGIWLVGDFSGWKKDARFALKRRSQEGDWEGRFPAEALAHGQFYRLEMEWHGGSGERLPAYARRVVQDPETHLFAAQVWDPPTRYRWRHRSPAAPKVPLIYEAHIGMAQEEEKVGSFDEFRVNVLPRIVAAGYNVIQLMAVMEHPYYGSFGYHVSSFFAVSSRFGTPEEFKRLVDAAHASGVRVIMDIVHSHAVKNERDGLSLFDGTPYLYFHDGGRGWHSAWDSRCFDYDKTCTLRFLLSNCRYWLEEYHLDGFRFDGVTSMLYHHHGLGVDFTEYAKYFDGTVDEDAWVYLNLANRVIHEVRPDAQTIAEDVSGMPGVGAPVADGGLGFDFRMAMGIPEFWWRQVRDLRDEDWSMDGFWYELTNRRAEERTVSYVESHDQALVGGKTFIFQMADAAMYDAMRLDQRNLAVERAVALHKLARLATVATGCAYLNFMGNEFGHPEWIDFPREGNGFSYHHARRQWSLRDDPALRFRGLGNFDAAVLALLRRTGALEAGPACKYQSSDETKTLVFGRGRLVFIFNFHSTASQVDFPVLVPPSPRGYRLALSSDDRAFCGEGRVASEQVFHLVPQMRGENELCLVARVYLPCRTALVLERIEE